jgi:hypothetical protein
MIYISYAIYKSGSTLAFDLTKSLLEKKGHPQKKLPPSIIRRRKKRNFVSPEFFLDRHWWNRLLDMDKRDKIIVLKTHSPPPPFINEFIRNGTVKVQIIFRDPRDSSLSLKDAGEQARRLGKGGFWRITDLNTAIQATLNGLSILERWMRVPEVRLFSYDQVAFDSRAFLSSVANQLNITAKDEECDSVIDGVKSGGKTLLNKGIPRRHRLELDEAEYQRLSAMFLPYVARLTPQVLDDRDRVILDNLPAKVDATQTKKTYVVLGCPRGGTSLLAGSLVAAGVHMGECQTRQYEDPEFKIHPRQADCAISYLSPVIRHRNLNLKEWGWKVPNSIYYIRNISDYLINPVYLFIYRDVASIARSSCKHDGRCWLFSRRKLLRCAKKHTDLVKQFESEVCGETYSFKLENIHKNPAEFADFLCKTVLQHGSPDQVLDFINPSGGYHRQ